MWSPCWRCRRNASSICPPVAAGTVAGRPHGGHLRREPLSPHDIADEISALRITTLSLTEPALRTAYLIVHDEMEHAFVPIIADRLGLADNDLTARVFAAAVTAAFRVIDEDVGYRAIVEKEKITQQQALAMIDRAIRDATNGQLGGPVPH